MNRLVCAVLGHRWVRSTYYAPRFYVCKRCGEPGWWVES